MRSDGMLFKLTVGFDLPLNLIRLGSIEFESIWFILIWFHFSCKLIFHSILVWFHLVRCSLISFYFILKRRGENSTVTEFSHDIKVLELCQSYAGNIRILADTVPLLDLSRPLYPYSLCDLYIFVCFQGQAVKAPDPLVLFLLLSFFYLCSPFFLSFIFFLFFKPSLFSLFFFLFSFSKIFLQPLFFTTSFPETFTEYHWNSAE